MLFQKFFVDEKEESLARKNPKLFGFFYTLETKLSFEQWFQERQFVIDTINSFDEDACHCSYYYAKCTDKCRVLFRNKFIILTERISSVTDDKLQFLNLMFLKSKVDTCKTHSQPLAESYIMEDAEDDEDNYFC